MATTEAAVAIGTRLQLCTAPLYESWLSTKSTSAMLSGKRGRYVRPGARQDFAAASVAAHLEQRDYMVTTYRGVHYRIAKSAPSREVCAEYIGKSHWFGGARGSARAYARAESRRPKCCEPMQDLLLLRILRSRLLRDLASTRGLWGLCVRLREDCYHG
jgi:hypothetical protein